MGCLKGNCLGNHAMCVSHALRMNHALPIGSIRIAITTALLLILFYTRIMMNWNKTQKLHALMVALHETIALLKHNHLWDHLPSSETICPPLRPFTLLWDHLPSFETICLLLAIPSRSIFTKRPAARLNILPPPPLRVKLQYLAEKVRDFLSPSRIILTRQDLTLALVNPTRNSMQKAWNTTRVTISGSPTPKMAISPGY